MVTADEIEEYRIQHLENQIEAFYRFSAKVARVLDEAMAETQPLLDIKAAFEVLQDDRSRIAEDVNKMIQSWKDSELTDTPPDDSN